MTINQSSCLKPTWNHRLPSRGIVLENLESPKNSVRQGSSSMSRDILWPCTFQNQSLLIHIGSGERTRALLTKQITLYDFLQRLQNTHLHFCVFIYYCHIYLGYYDLTILLFCTLAFNFCINMDLRET